MLGHLFMKKFDMSRESRSHLIRSTGVSSRLKDIERLMKASDFDDGHRGDERRAFAPRQRRETFAVEKAFSSSSLAAMTDSSSEHDTLEVAVQDSLGSDSHKMSRFKRSM